MTDLTEERIPTIDVKTLIDQLQGLPDDTRVGFSGLNFYRVKWRGQTMINIEFNEHVYRDSKGHLVVEAPEPQR
ncbi:hypothetical protein DBR45_11215 [Pseudomonas sp. HMWF031]|nr:hypothetical protein DBR45_11215 [Pseudomonas sp. HMWF031]